VTRKGGKSFPSRFDAPEQSAGFLLWQTSMVWQRRQRAALEALDLTHAQFVLLASAFWLTRGQAELTQAALAAQAQVDVMMTSQVLRTLEQKGYVRRVAHSRDTRAKAVTVTPAGAALASKALAVVEGVDERFFAPLGPRQAELLRLLAELVAAARGGAADDPAEDG
jgi:DNA-binding MarR family transcriptional regulator